MNNRVCINFERFKPSMSVRSSKTISEWTEALRDVNTDQSRLIQHPQRGLFRGYAFPDPLIFLEGDKGTENFLAWLIIRAPWMSTLTGIEQRQHPLPNPQYWRTYLREIALDFELVRTDQRRHRAQVAQVSRTGRRNQKNRDVIKDIFTCPRPTRDVVTSISWNGHIIWTPGSVNIQLADYQLAVWDLHEHNFRAEIMSLDRCIMSHVWRTPQGRIVREQKLRAVFYGEVSLMAAAPVGFQSIASQNPRDRCIYVEAFRLVLADWPGDVPVCLSALQFRRSANGKEDEWDLGIMQAVEKMAFAFYCQTFFDYFGRAPTVPHTMPA